jgi:ABC-type bacteriocin/lantibiotic exporter with double-glycine peptidase domain
MKRFFLLCVVAVCGVLALTALSGGFMATAQTQQDGHTYHITLTVHQLVRIDQLDPSQYASSQEYQTWAYSTCSTAALAEVFNSYGRSYRIHDVLLVQARIGEITPELGLVEDVGIARTAATFGFKTSWGYSLSYDQVVATANHGTPVIVGWPPSRYPGGHLVVITGGNAQMVRIADSSRYDRSSVSRTQFMRWWAGFSAIITPSAQGGQS